MNSSLCETSSALTDSDLITQYGNGVSPGLLPVQPFQSSERTEKGVLSESTLKQLIQNFKSTQIIPTKIDTKEKVQLLLNNIKKEYCFYDTRYKYALQKLFDTVKVGLNNPSVEIKNNINNYLQLTRKLNQKLNDLTQIVDSISQEIIKINAELKNEITQFNNEIKDKKTKIEEQNDILSSGQAVSILNKKMVKYTEEKAKYTNNLLKLYSFLNIVALGLLVYVYRSAS